MISPAPHRRSEKLFIADQIDATGTRMPLNLSQIVRSSLNPSIMASNFIAFDVQYWPRFGFSNLSHLISTLITEINYFDMILEITWIIAID